MLWCEREWFDLEPSLSAAPRQIRTDWMIAQRRLFRRRWGIVEAVSAGWEPTAIPRPGRLTTASSISR